MRPPLLKLLSAAAVFASLTVLPRPTASAADPVPPEFKYRVVRRIPLKGDTGWDYLTIDDKARRLYVTRGTFVSVHDADTGNVVGEIAETPGVHGVALAPALGQGYTSNGRDNSVTVFDLRTRAAITKLPVGQNPDALVYEPVTSRVFVFNGRSKNATVIDAGQNKVVGDFAVGGKPEFAVADGRGSVFVNVEDTGEVLKIDAKSMTVKARWPLAPGTEPTGLAIDAKNSRLFVGCGNRKLMILEATTGRIIASLDIGAGVDAVAFDSASGGIFTSNGGDGSLTVARAMPEDKFEVVETVSTLKSGRTMAFDPWTRHIFVVAAKFGQAPAPTAEQPHPRPPILDGSVTLFELAPQAVSR